MNQSVSQLNLADFNTIEVQPVQQVHAELDSAGKTRIAYEVCEPEKADTWTVYLRRKDNGQAHAVADCPDQATAGIMLDALTKRHPYLINLNA